MELIRNFVSNDKEDEVKVRFRSEDDPQIRTYAFSHLFNQEHYSEAALYLDEVQDNNSDWQEFKRAQTINLRRAEDYGKFTTDQQEIDFLFNAGNKHTFYATWIRSIYTAVSGDAIIFDLPQGAGGRQAKPTNDLKVESDINVFPNPTADDIQIAGLEADLQYHIKICDITGKTIREIAGVSENDKLDISAMENGVYIIQIYDSEAVMIHASKITKIR